MIRAYWVLLNSALATMVFGPLVFLGVLFRIRGGLYDWIARQWAGAVMWSSGARLKAYGRDRIDWSRPQVVVCNHVSAFDILALALTIPVPFHFVAKKELERVPLFGPAWKAAGHISIDRENRARAIESLKRAGDMVRRDGGVVIIFPEGTRSKTGELQPFKKGAFNLAIQADLPIVPSVVIGSDRITPAGAMHVRKGTFELHYGEPIETSAYTPEQVDDLAALVRGRMEEMLRNGGELPDS